MDEKKYLYSINPRRTIKNIAGIPAIRTSRSLFLSKDEVLVCIKSASVYRRFSADNIVKVTPFTLDRLHRKEFLTVKEYEKLLADEKGKERGITKEVKPIVDSKEKAADEKSPESRETSVTNVKVPEKVSEPDKEADIKADLKEGSEQTTIVNENIVRVSDKVEVKDSVSTQTKDDKNVDEKPNFQPSSIQVNTGKKKHKY